jgi:hypothetical protein
MVRYRRSLMLVGISALLAGAALLGQAQKKGPLK